MPETPFPALERFVASVTLQNCEDEPIRIPGSIQPHGVLLAMRPADLKVCRVSANVSTVFGVSVEDLESRGLSAILDDDRLDEVRECLRNPASVTRPRYLFTLSQARDGRPYDAIAHCSDGEAVLELEPAESSAAPTVAEQNITSKAIQDAFEVMDRAGTLDELYVACVSQVRRITGFDRVMIYRFDAEWNGTVIAEDRRQDLEPFLNLHYPASDIPRQARELYTLNWLRFIADRDYVASPVVAVGEDGPKAPLDMSQAVLRSVSPIHLEYLRNMGVGASMSISILKEGRLWGLVACHHYSPKYVPYSLRASCELFGRVLSLQLPMKERKEIDARAVLMAETARTLAKRLADVDGMAAALTEGPLTLLDMIPASGAVVMIGDTHVRMGQTPGTDDLLAIAEWLDRVEAGTDASLVTSPTASDDIGETPSDVPLVRMTSDGVIETDRLGAALQRTGLGAVAAGLLAISIGRDQRTRAIWFRSEQIRTVHWAGDPAKSVVKGDAGMRLSPRGSFALWQQVVRGRCTPWTAGEQEAAAILRRELVRHMIARAEQLLLQNQSLELATRQAKDHLQVERDARLQFERLNELKDAFVATLSHELRTPLNAILGWTQILRRKAVQGQDDDSGQPLEIIERNTRMQVQMIEDLLDVSRITSGKLRLDVQPVNLSAVVNAALSTVQPAVEAKQIRVAATLDPLHGVEVNGDPVRLQQVVWNLLINAVKFTPAQGSIRVLLRRVSSNVEITITDSGVGIDSEFLPFVFDRFRQHETASTRKYGGLGLGLSIVRHIVELHGGTVHAHSGGIGEGATFVVTLPLRVLRLQRPERQPEHPTHASSETSADTHRVDLSGLRILIVEDEPDSRIMLRSVLKDSGAQTQEAGSVNLALETYEAAVAQTDGQLDQTGRPLLPFDLLISDIGMPDRDGIELIGVIRQAEATAGRPRMPAIALTAYARAEDRRRVMMAGFQVHVAKPVEASELLAVVASLTNRL